MTYETTHSTANNTETFVDRLQPLDRDGVTVDGIGRLDQIIGADEAAQFFAEKATRSAFLLRRAQERWGVGGQGYSRART